jgi:hypothetical protein
MKIGKTVLTILSMVDAISDMVDTISDMVDTISEMVDRVLAKVDTVPVVVDILDTEGMMIDTISNIEVDTVLEMISHPVDIVVDTVSDAASDTASDAAALPMATTAVKEERDHVHVLLNLWMVAQRTSYMGDLTGIGPP